MLFLPYLFYNCYIDIWDQLESDNSSFLLIISGLERKLQLLNSVVWPNSQQGLVRSLMS